MATQHRRPRRILGDAASAVDWSVQPQRIIDHYRDTWTWFPDAALNMSVNCLDRHVDAGRGEVLALRYHSAMTGTRKDYTYRQLRDRVAQFAGALQDLGVTRGDRVLLYLPMTPEAVIAMLACARLGAIHSVVFGGFAATELAVRIADARPSVLITASGGLEPGRVVEYLPIVRKALEAAPGIVRTVVVRDRAAVAGSAAEMDGSVDGVRWCDWDAIAAAAGPAAPVPVVSSDPLYVLYTSGTTGSPKGIIRDTGGYAVALAWAMRNIYDIGPGDTMFTASDVGWVVGHSFIVYGPLLAGATTVLYEGKPVGTPDASEFWRIVEDYGVKTMFTAPTALRAIRRVDPDLEGLPPGPSDAADALPRRGAARPRDLALGQRWTRRAHRRPLVADRDGLADLRDPGGVRVPAGQGRLDGRADARLRRANPRRQGPRPHRHGRGRVDARRQHRAAGAAAAGDAPRRMGSPGRFHEAYLSAFPGFYATGDAGHIDEDGYVFVMGRTDDVINVAGHRLSTGSLEEVLTMHHAVAECAVIGVHDDLKGQRAAGFVTLKAHATIEHDVLEAELVALVREHVGPVAAFRDVTILDRLPKTRSGKILRKTMRQIVDGEP